MKRGAAGLLIGIGVLAGLLLWLREPAPEPRARPHAGAAPSAAGEGAPASVVRVPGGDAKAPLPPSLAGTREDGALVVDSDGRFVPTPDAIDLFDYYLSATGEEPDERLEARIRASIRARLDGPAAAQAEALLDDYLAYRARAGELLAGPLVGEDLDRRLQYIQELRREVFGSGVAAALFGEEEARWSADLERRRIATDPDLTPEERDRHLAALDADASDTRRESVEAVQAHSLLRRDEAELREAGASPAEIAGLREDRFGAEAAARLEALDASRAEWQRRVHAYREERDHLLADAAPEERDSLLQDIRARHFDGGELLRIRAADKQFERGVEVR